MLEAVQATRLQRAANDLFPRAESRGFEALDERDRTLFCVWLFCGEVDSGGFEQFFHDDAGQWAEETARALERIGADDAAALLREGMALFPRGRVPRDADDRNEVIEDLAPEARRALADLDDRFQELGSDAVVDRLATWYLG